MNQYLHLTVSMLPRSFTEVRNFDSLTWLDGKIAIASIGVGRVLENTQIPYFPKGKILMSLFIQQYNQMPFEFSERSYNSTNLPLWRPLLQRSAELVTAGDRSASRWLPSIFESSKCFQPVLNVFYVQTAVKSYQFFLHLNYILVFL